MCTEARMYVHVYGWNATLPLQHEEGSLRAPGREGSQEPRVSQVASQDGACPADSSCGAALPGSPRSDGGVAGEVGGGSVAPPLAVAADTSDCDRLGESSEPQPESEATQTVDGMASSELQWPGGRGSPVQPHPHPVAEEPSTPSLPHLPPAEPSANQGMVLQP